MLNRVICLIALAGCAACSSAEDMGETIGVERVAGASLAETQSEQLERRFPTDAEAKEFKSEDSRGEASRDFAYSWPAQVSAIEPLAAYLTGARDEALAKQVAEWEQSIEEFADFDCITCVNRSFEKGWAVAADTKRFLVLSADTFTYTGGAHGNTVFDALLWDREADNGKGAAMRPVDLFASETALENTAYGDYCEALMVERAERNDMNVEDLNAFDNCPSVTSLVVVPQSANGETFDTILFLAAPYVAGSFAEGPYAFSIPMNEAVLSAVKPEYRTAFSIGG